MSLHIVSQNPYRILGVLSNSPLKERVGNQNRLAAFAKVGKEVSFANDFVTILTDKPVRTPESIAVAHTAINLDKDQLKYAFFWFIRGSSLDVIALKHLQTGNREKAVEIFQKKETYSSLINLGVLAFIEGNITVGFSNISKVVHNSTYRAELLQTLGLANLQLSEDNLANLMIAELLKELPASTLLTACTNSTDRAIVSHAALNEPISTIDSAIAVAKNADTKNPEASLAAGTKLMNSTKSALAQIKNIAGVSSPQYKMAADNLAKQILQCGINYYNNATEDDLESPRKAMVLQSYALSIAVGQLIKDRCQENYDILKQAVDSMPPVEVTSETRKVKDELRKFCQLPDKIEYSINLLNATKPLLQTIKSKLGANNSFYLSLSTQVVGNALHNLIQEVNFAQTKFGAMVEACKTRAINPAIVGSSLLSSINTVLREAWRATTIMDSFDMESDFRHNRYYPNRKSLKEMCDDLDISTDFSSSTTRSSYSSSSTVSRPSTVSSSSTSSRPSTTSRSSTSSKPSTTTSSSSDEGLPIGCWVVIIIAIIIFLCNIL